MPKLQYVKPMLSLMNYTSAIHGTALALVMGMNTHTHHNTHNTHITPRGAAVDARTLASTSRWEHCPATVCPTAIEVAEAQEQLDELLIDAEWRELFDASLLVKIGFTRTALWTWAVWGAGDVAGIETSLRALLVATSSVHLRQLETNAKSALAMVLS